MTAFYPQLLLHLNEVVVFLANFIREALATTGLYRRTVIAARTPHINHCLRVGGPFALHRLKALEAIDLLRVIADQLLQALQLRADLRLGDDIGVEKMLIPGNQITAHAGLKVDRQLRRFVGVTDHSITVLYPTDHREQIADHHHEQHGTEHTHGQRQANVSIQQLAKAALIN